MSLLSYLKPKGKNGFGYGSTAKEVTEGISLNGKTFLLTGCNSGIGKETLRVLKLRGANIIGSARTKQKAEEALNEIGGGLGLEIELSNPSSIIKSTEEIKKQNIKLDGIICNAGIMALPNLEKSFGYELQFFTNHIGHFLFVTNLLDSLQENCRVVVLSSAAHFIAPKEGIDFDNLKAEKYYSPWTFYGQSKFANLVFAKELARKFQGTNKLSFAVHPGVIKTNLSRHFNPILNLLYSLTEPIFLKSIPQGAATSTYLATNKLLSNDSGSYFSDVNKARERPDANSIEIGKKLWEVSERIIKECIK